MGLQELPAELVVAICEYLPQRDLRSASTVSRTLYYAAQDTGLYIHRLITFDAPYNLPKAIEAFIALVNYAINKPHGPGLALTLYCDRVSKFHLHMPSLLPAIKAALPLLVYLSLGVPAECSDTLYRALCFPAPRLRVLALGQVRARDALAQNHVLPHNIFAGSARRLREVYLSINSLDDVVQQPIPAFHGVRHVHLHLTSAGQHLFPARFFPSVRALWLFVGHCDSNPIDTPVDLRGLNLQHLSIGTNLLQSVRSDTPLRNLRYVEQIGTRWNPALFPECDERGGFAAHYTRMGCPERLSFGSRDGSWTRALWVPPAGLSKKLTMLSARLVVLTVHDMYLYDFIACKVTLEALAELILDETKYHWVVHRPRIAPNPGHRVRCPALNTLSILSADGKGQTVDSAIVPLARLLGLTERAEAEGVRPVLQLIGVSFVHHAKREPLQRIFAHIRDGLPFSAAVAEQHYRGAGEGSELDLTHPFTTKPVVRL